MNYKATATVRNKAGKELVWKKLVWAGEASSPREAMEHARGALKQLVVSTQGADTIALNLSDEKGGLTTSTEYAEDFTIGYGASAVGSSALMNDAVEHGLSDAQMEAAQKALEQRAVKAMPGIAEKLAEKVTSDPMRDFFGDGYKPRKSEEELSEEPAQTIDIGQVYRDAGLANGPGRPYPHDFKGFPPIPGHPGAGDPKSYPPHNPWDKQHAQTTGPRQYGKSHASDMLEQLRETHREFQQATGRQVHSVVMGDQAYELARKQVSKELGHEIAPGSPFTYDGVEIHKAPGSSAPPIQIVPKPRASSTRRTGRPVNLGPGTVHITGADGQERFVGKTDQFIIEDEAAQMDLTKLRKFFDEKGYDLGRGQIFGHVIDLEAEPQKPIDVKFYGVDFGAIETKLMADAHRGPLYQRYVMGQWIDGEGAIEP